MSGLESYPYSPTDYSRVMKLGEQMIKNVTQGINLGEGGRIFTVVTDPADQAESDLFLTVLRTELGIKPEDERHIDVSSVLIS